jgi:phage terminase large subunit-like protein
VGSARGLTRGERNVAWIEQHCRTPEGKAVRKPIVLRDWQREIICGIYDSPTRRAIVSFGRKNGKTAISAMLLLLHLAGPEARPNSQLYSAAQSLEQAAVLFGLAAKMVRMSPDLSQYVTVRDTVKQLHCRELGTLYRALSAEASTAFGLSPVFTVHDELGQVKGPRSSLYEALETGSAAHDDPLSIVISTQAPTDADLLSLLISDAQSGADPRVKLWLYTAPLEIEDAFGEEAIRLANPAFGDFQNAEEVLALAADAKRMPSREPEYRNLVLNQRVEARSPFVARSVWKANGAAPHDLDGPVYLGLDLSSVSDLTALVAIGMEGGECSVVPTFWLPAAHLAEKSRKDRVEYDTWAKQGSLETTPGASIEYEFVAEHLRGVFQQYDVRKVAFDRWGWKHLEPWLRKAGFGDDEIAKFEPFGQGFQSMAPALRELESLLLNHKIRHGDHPVLTMCAANAVTQTDSAGNRKLIKDKSPGRIDGMVALAMAVGVASSDMNAEIIHDGTAFFV